MESTIAERLRLEVDKGAEREEATKIHKAASRAFFDTLEAFYPPENTPEYWDRLYEAIVTAYVKAGRPALLRHLYVATIDYFEEIVRAREEVSDEPGATDDHPQVRGDGAEDVQRDQP